MIFPPCIALESFEDLSLLNRQLYLVLVLKEEYLGKNSSELTLFVRSVLEVFVDEEVFLDDAVMRNATYAFVRLLPFMDMHSLDILDYAHFAVLCVRINRPELIPLSNKQEELLNVMEMFQDAIPEASEIIKNLHHNEHPEMKAQEIKETNEFMKMLDDNKRDVQKILWRADREDEEDDAETFGFENKPLALDPVTKKLLPVYINNRKLLTKTERKSKERAELCEKLKMTHEQIEGWALVFERNPQSKKIIAAFEGL